VAASCESCHVGDGKGHPVTTLTRFGRYDGDVFDPMLAFGGPQLQHRSIPGYPAEVIPAEATGVTRLMPPAVTGLGFLEAVEDAALLALADPDDADGDGISGVPNWIDPPDFFTPEPHQIAREGRYIGRFGKKAAALNLLHQTVGAYLQDMGITTDFALDDTHNIQAGVFTGDNAPDPEVSSDVLKNVVFYVRTLKAPPRRNETDADVRAGEVLFDQIDCARCHVPTLMTGKTDVEALSEKVFHPYTDLLLHDMGPGLDDGYTEGSALTSEWRTAPLWGIGLAEDSQGGQAFYLHDGRATTLREAIDFHRGEAAISRSAFGQLSAEALSLWTDSPLRMVMLWMPHSMQFLDLCGPTGRAAVCTRLTAMSL
ncbi:MAG: hypothetical protein IH820_05740, partial [Bacteroidetes bacterium]|nr:hypothetical protein [Bacteroidota bacterium]